MVRLGKLHAKAEQGLRIVYDQLHRGSLLGFDEWLAGHDGPAERLAGMDALLFHDDLLGVQFEGDAYSAVRTAQEVVSFVHRMCADPHPTVEEMVEQMMRGAEVDP